MATIKNAKKKWEDKVEGKGAYWQKRVNEAIENDKFCTGVAEFLGVKSCSTEVAKSWQEGVKNKANAFNEGVKGKSGKWAKNYAEKMAGVSVREEE